MKKAGTDDESCDSEDGISIHASNYEYHTAATHHTTSEMEQLEDIREGLSMEVEVHDGSKRTCSVIGTLALHYNGKTMRHEQCLYDSSFSNIVSGLRMPENYDMKARGAKVIIKAGKKILYKIEPDSQGMWIKVDEQKIKSSKAKEMYERKHSKAISGEKATHHTSKC